ncbi:FadR/GntR family transcriptional regulator [Rubellimicrobium sp. CFH 75288]|uniref:FadR/GntR family transcriptional regulator n=1 Tax=Rubellimicrobium sp. CFH 75288 TaxID=2697034 RepID=UPI001411CE02|nr:GntR family transcriptional regulator [Rubellimicrobium sp. CFH 75288]NAZ35322.1 GntR family transcriptional regulator [Rubellimicrobium sp. CFH 75288]
MRHQPLEGTIQFRGILGETVADLGQRIVGGEWAPGSTIPREADLVESLGVSRSVIREAIRILGAKGLVRSRTSDGTRVLPHDHWRLLDPDVIGWRIRAGDRATLLLELLRVRSVIEPGVVWEATRSASPAARERIRAAWAAKVAAFESPDPDLAIRRHVFVETDIEFHRAFLSAVDSPLLDQLFNVVEAALKLLFELQIEARGFDSGMVGLEDGHRLHAAVMEAWERGECAEASAAMRQLLREAVRDAEAAMQRMPGSRSGGSPAGSRLRLSDKAS